MKKVIALMLSLLLIFAFVACSTEPESEEVTGTTEIKITDVTGREITLPQIATKVVGTHNPSLNAVVVLGGGEKYIAGFGNKEMSRGLYSEVIKNYDDLVQIGKAGNINYESVIATGADLAVLPERFKDQADKFSEVGVNALIALPNRESFDTVKASLAMIGQALGEDERASAINAFLDSKITKAQEISSKAADKPSVL
ncbi:MAG: ABC transporter substrate-binding protein, partial [Peptostreptococcales bacterium]